MDPSADAFVPGQEYEIPSAWGAGQQHNTRNAFVALASSMDNHSYLPPVIHRFQKQPTNSAVKFRNQYQSLVTNTRTLQDPASLDVGLQSRPMSLSSRNPSVKDESVESKPFQTVSRAKPSNFDGLPLRTSTQTTKFMEEFRPDESASNGK